MSFVNVSIFILFCLSLSASEHDDTDKIDPSKTIVWGPGLSPEKITMRSRYFFLHLVDSNGTNLTESPTKETVFAEIKGKNSVGYPCRIWTHVLDCKDGSFIIRYRVYETCNNLSIKIKVKNKIVHSASSISKGPVYEEECNCPLASISNWKKQAECRDNYPQILKDMEPFVSLDFDKIRNEVIKEFNRPTSVSICHYVIKNNKIYRKCYGQHVGFKMFSDSILLSLARKVILPDVEFFMNLGDWPLVKKSKTPYPIFSWCGSKDTGDIILPTYDITESSIENMGRVMLDMLSVQGNTKVPWEKKIEKVFWRGRDSRRERLDLIDISRKNPDLFNVSITNFFFFRDEIEKYGPGERHVSFFDFFKYKYQLNIDGTVAAYRFPYLLAGDSLVFKQESGYHEHFYDQVKPYEHYVPVKHDLSDLVDKINWAINNDEEARKISKAGRDLMRDIALPRDIYCYHLSLFHEWSRRITNKIKVLEGMEEVFQPEHECPCVEILKNSEDDFKAKDEL